MNLFLFALATGAALSLLQPLQWYINSNSLPYGGLHWLRKWQDWCYRASRELCSNYLFWKGHANCKKSL